MSILMNRILIKLGLKLEATSVKQALCDDNIRRRYVYQQINISESPAYLHSKNDRFRECYIPVLGLKLKPGYVFWLIFKVYRCSATSFKRSRRELSIYVAEHTSILKNNQNTYYLRFSCTLKTGVEIPVTGVAFLLVLITKVDYISIL